MAQLSISLLGPMQTHLAEKPVVTFESNRVRALFAYLAVEATRTHHRQKLAALLWPDWPDATARKNLRSALPNLRKAISDHQADPSFLLITRETIQFNPASNYQLDVKTLLQATEQGSSATIQQVETAIDLCRGEFLEGFSLADSPPFEEWLLILRERLQRRILAALQRLASHYEFEGDYGRACYYARRQIELDSFREEAHRHLMQLLATTGETSMALAHYDQYQNLVSAELGTQPAPETIRLFTQIKTGTFDAGREQSSLWQPIVTASQPSKFLPTFLASVQPSRTSHKAVFVARQKELTQLTAHLEAALVGQGKIIFVVGDAGSGKTRLLQEFAHFAQEKRSNLLVTGGGCSAHTGEGDPYLPFRESIRLLTGDIEAKWLAGSLTRSQATYLWSTLPQVIQHLVSVSPALIDSFVPKEPLLDRLSEFTSTKPDQLEALRIRVEAIRQRSSESHFPQSDLFDQVAAFLQAVAKDQPLLITLDDLHWVDPGSLNLLFHLGRCLAGYPILIVGSYRPEEVAAGRDGKRHPLEVVRNEFRRTWGDILVDLNAVDGRHFVDALLNSEPHQLDRQFREDLFQRSMGHALFTVELVHSLRTSGALIKDDLDQWRTSETLDWNTMPARVEAVIAERLDRLPVELKKILTVASIEGESFTAEVVGRLVDINDQIVLSTLNHELEDKHDLVKAIGMQRVGQQRLTRYQFRHTLFQEYLYENQNDIERMLLHEAVANTLISLYGAQADEMAVQLAHHFREAGVVEQAIDYFKKAGQQAIQLSASQEAEAHFNSALTLLPQLSDKRTRIQQEIALQLSLGVVYGALHGHAAPAATNAYERATVLVEQIEQASKLFPGLWGLWRTYHVGAQLPKALALGQQLIKLAENAAEPIHLVGAHQALGATLYFMGKLKPAVKHLEQCLALYDVEQHPTYISLYGDDPGVVALCHLSQALFRLGYFERAEEQMAASIALAQQVDHPASLVFTLSFTASLIKQQGHLTRYRVRLEEIIILCMKYQIPQWLNMISTDLEWLIAATEDPEAGLSLMQERLIAWQGTGSFLGQTRFLKNMTKLYSLVDQLEEGLSLLDQVLTVMHETEERLNEAELYRLKGQLLWEQSGSYLTDDTLKKIETCFLQAIDVAQRQQAKFWELRATISLSRLYIEQGKLDVTRQRLAAIYDWFADGFDYPDLQQADELLNQLTKMRNSA